MVTRGVRYEQSAPIPGTTGLIAFHPKATKTLYPAGLLTYSFLIAFPSSFYRQWLMIKTLWNLQLRG